MNLSNFEAVELAEILPHFEQRLREMQPRSARIFARIAETACDFQTAREQDHYRQDGLKLAAEMGIKIVDDFPANAYSWDGDSLRSRSEPWVFIHEIAHWQIAAEKRLNLLDFGLGAGPESGKKQEADKARSLFGEALMQEEIMASLLGILWEVELGQPAIHAFIEQNWLEGHKRDSAKEFFIKAVAMLDEIGVLDQEGRPQKGRFPRPL